MAPSEIMQLTDEQLRAHTGTGFVGQRVLLDKDEKKIIFSEKFGQTRHS
jgi:hypothetical protein